MPTARRRRRIRMGMAGLAAVTLTAASGGAAMGWVMGGTTADIETYKRSVTTRVPSAGRSSSSLVSLPSNGASSPATMAMAAIPQPAPAYFPANNTVQWATSVAPGQALSGISVRNGDTDTNLIAHFTARAVDGSWMPVASMTISPGRESVLHPPAGEYAMQLVASPITMAYDRIASIPRSPAVNFVLPPQSPSATPSVRYSISRGRIDRLPDPSMGAASTEMATRSVTGRIPARTTTERDDPPMPMMPDREDENADPRTYTDGTAS